MKQKLTAKVKSVLSLEESCSFQVVFCVIYNLANVFQPISKILANDSSLCCGKARVLSHIQPDLKAKSRSRC